MKFIVERVASLFTAFAAAAYLIFGDSSESFFRIMLPINTGIFISSNLLPLADYYLELDRNGNSRVDIGIFPRKSWLAEEISAFWTETVGAMLQIVCCFWLDVSDRAIILACIVSISLFPVANMIYFLCGLSRLLEPITNGQSPQKESKDTEIMYGDTENVESLMINNEEELFKEKSKENGEEFVLEKQDGSEDGQTGSDHDRVNEEPMSNMTTSYITDAKKEKNIGKVVDYEGLVDMIEEKHNEIFEKSEERWEEILRKLRVKYEADRGKWKEEKDILIRKLAVVKESADLYRNLLHDLGCY